MRLTGGANLGARRSLDERFRELGILLVECGLGGDLLKVPSCGQDWLADLVCHSAMGRKLFRDAAGRWAGGGDGPRAVEPMPGVWLVPLPVQARKRRISYAVGVLLTQRLIESEHLVRLCQSAKLDLMLLHRQLTKLPLTAATEVPRLTALIAQSLDDQQQRVADHHSIEDLSRQLGESYEEMNLLYTITQGISVGRQSDHFVALVCDELLATLPYRWIGVHFRDGDERLGRLAGQFIMSGQSSHSTSRIIPHTRQLLRQIEASVPLVIEPAFNLDHAIYADLGRAVLVHPVNRDGVVIAVLVAGEKAGSDLTASSVDMQLVGAAAAHLAIFLENASLYDDLNAMFLGTLEALTSAIDAKDPYTRGHSQRVAHLTEQLALAAGVDEESAGRMRIAGLVHDVGKIGVPESVLTKPGRLSMAEFACIRKHPEIGHRILRDIPQLNDILPGVLHHHERWDGRGYPHELSGADIPLVARMIGLADTFDAMSSNRTYRNACSREAVIKEIESQAGRQFDPELAGLFLQLDFTEFEVLMERHMLESDEEYLA